MKDFTKPELIQDVTNDILKHYTPDFKICEFFPGTIAGLKKNGTNKFYLLRPFNNGYYEPDFFTVSERAATLYRALDQYCKAVETYPGELWRYYNNEYKRITAAINKALIKAVKEIKTA